MIKCSKEALGMRPQPSISAQSKLVLMRNLKLV